MDQSRRLFLRGRTSVDKPALRLPWAVDDAIFTAHCTRCSDCLRACPEQIIVQGDGGFPRVDFSKGECTFCHACAEACSQPLFHESNVPWNASAVITKNCLTQQQVFCQNCKDACPATAILFSFGQNGISHPHIVADNCTGCGACVAPCPAGAIQIEPTTSTPP